MAPSRIYPPVGAGDVFGRLTVERSLPSEKVRGDTIEWWSCRCACGAVANVRDRALKYGRKKSCGCAKEECKRAIGGYVGRQTKHGGCKNRECSPEYSCWQGLLARCRYPKHKQYADYGGRGITIADRWVGDRGFENFLADMGARPPGTTLDRYPDNDGPYAPSNCRWATRTEQARNKRNSHFLTFNGHTATMAEWAERTGFSYSAIMQRIRGGWSVERALTEPVRNQRRFG